MSVRIYLDYNATAKIRPEVDALANSMSTVGNASSVHTAGREARKSVETRAGRWRTSWGFRTRLFSRAVELKLITK